MLNENFDLSLTLDPKPSVQDTLDLLDVSVDINLVQSDGHNPDKENLQDEEQNKNTAPNNAKNIPHAKKSSQPTVFGVFSINFWAYYFDVNQFEIRDRPTS